MTQFLKIDKFLQRVYKNGKNKQIKRWLIIREMQIKTMTKYYAIPIKSSYKKWGNNC